MLWDDQQSSPPVDHAAQVDLVGNEAVPQSDDDGESPGTAVPPEQAPVEIVQSIYDQDFDYTVRANAAADETMAHVSHGSFIRWQPIYVDPKSVLSDGYLSDGAMPSHMKLSLFPDLSFVIDLTDYTVMEQTFSAVWNGTIRGAEDSKARISIVGGEDSPGFVIQLYDHPKAYSIMQSATEPDVYIAVEWANKPDATFD